LKNQGSNRGDKPEIYLEADSESALDTRDNASKELDSMLDIIGGGIEIQTEIQVDDVDLGSIRWSQWVPRLSDKIGDTFVAISVPSERGWHTMVSLGKYLVLFGGFRYCKTKVPQPFSFAAKHEDVEYLSDLFVYDSENLSWHQPPVSNNGPRPAGRYESKLSQYIYIYIYSSDLWLIFS
jgi:hypothetical protein